MGDHGARADRVGKHIGDTLADRERNDGVDTHTEGDRSGRDHRPLGATRHGLESGVRVEVEHRQTRTAVIERRGADEKVPESNRWISVEHDVAERVPADDQARLGIERNVAATESPLGHPVEAIPRLP
jgi:hypothetical protein